MRKFIFVLPLIFAMSFSISIMAQPEHIEEMKRAREEMMKELDYEREMRKAEKEYYREMSKAEAEYVREINKADEEFYREILKAEREAYREYIKERREAMREGRILPFAQNMPEYEDFDEEYDDGYEYDDEEYDPFDLRNHRRDDKFESHREGKGKLKGRKKFPRHRRN